MNNSALNKIDVSKTVRTIMGPLLAALVFIFFRPEGLPIYATYVAAIATWMAIWWATEATNVAVTAFLPLILFPLFGISTMQFIMALAIEKSGLHQRAALRIFQVVGVNAKAIVGGFMIAAALLSMWISNTSTALMMLPIATSVVYVVRENMDELAEKEIGDFEISIFLGLAYGATMGGIATLVGTPPNAFMAGFMQTTYGVEVDFARWMIIGVPLTVVMLPIIWIVLVKILYPVNFMASERTTAHLNAKRNELGKPSVAEKRTGILFLLLVAGWMLRKPLAELTGAAEISDSAIAMMAGMLAFLIPSGKNGEALLTWDDTKRLPWGVLILFGGGHFMAW